MIKKMAVMALSIMAASSIAEAGKIERERAKDSPWPINWKYRNGEILYDTVCQDKGKGSVAYRNCRREAQKLFRERCKKAKNKASDMHCIAGNRYFP